MAGIWRPEDNFVESTVFFHLCLVPRDQTRVAWLARQVSLLAEPSHQPSTKHLDISTLTRSGHS